MSLKSIFEYLILTKSTYFDDDSCRSVANHHNFNEFLLKAIFVLCVPLFTLTVLNLNGKMMAVSVWQKFSSSATYSNRQFLFLFFFLLPMFMCALLCVFAMCVAIHILYIYVYIFQTFVSLYWIESVWWMINWRKRCKHKWNGSVVDEFMSCYIAKCTWAKIRHILLENRNKKPNNNERRRQEPQAHTNNRHHLKRLPPKQFSKRLCLMDGMSESHGFNDCISDGLKRLAMHSAMLCVARAPFAHIHTPVSTHNEICQNKDNIVWVSLSHSFSQRSVDSIGIGAEFYFPFLSFAISHIYCLYFSLFVQKCVLELSCRFQNVIFYG